MLPWHVPLHIPLCPEHTSTLMAIPSVRLLGGLHLLPTFLAQPDVTPRCGSACASPFQHSPQILTKKVKTLSTFFSHEIEDLFLLTLVDRVGASQGLYSIHRVGGGGHPSVVPQ